MRQGQVIPPACATCLRCQSDSFPEPLMDGRWVWTVFNALYWILAYPLIILLTWLLAVLFWITSPFIYTISFLLELVLLPLRFLARFEVRRTRTIYSTIYLLTCSHQTLYIFFGVAVLLGLAAGVILHLMTRTSANLLGLDKPLPPKDKPAKGHTAASYRASRKQKQKLELELSNATKARMQTLQPLQEPAQRPAGRQVSVARTPTMPKRSPGLLGTTILEEVEDTDEDFDF